MRLGTNARGYCFLGAPDGSQNEFSNPEHVATVLRRNGETVGSVEELRAAPREDRGSPKHPG